MEIMQVFCGALHKALSKKVKKPVGVFYDEHTDTLTVMFDGDYRLKFGHILPEVIKGALSEDLSEFCLKRYRKYILSEYFA